MAAPGYSQGYYAGGQQPVYPPNPYGQPQQYGHGGYPAVAPAGAYGAPKQGSDAYGGAPTYPPQQQAYPAYQYGGYPAAQPAGTYAGPVPPMASPPHASPPVVVDIGEGGPGTGTAYRGESKYLDQLDKSVRMGFIRKVYLILSLQLLVTFGMVALFTFSEPVKARVQSSPAFLWSAVALSFGFLIALSCCPGVARSWPTNMLCLGGFTLTEGYLVGAIASTYSTDAVLKAVAATVIIMLALTAFAWQTKIDFTAMGGVFLCLLIVLILFGIWTAIFPSQAARTAYAALGAFVFACFIVYDTQMIVGGQHVSCRFEVDDYVFAALNIYLDIINLFLYLLRLFGNSRD